MSQLKTKQNSTAQRNDDFIVVPTCCGLVVVSHQADAEEHTETSAHTTLSPVSAGTGFEHGKRPQNFKRAPTQALPLDTVLSSLTWLLLAIAAITMVVEEKSNVLAISAALFTITAVGLFSEYKARQSLRSGRSIKKNDVPTTSLGQAGSTAQLN
ncbi:MAG: hypothetical protein RIC14_09775 [Filomicrobium sp.]